MPNKNGFRLEFKTAKTDGKGEVMIYSTISDFRYWGDEVTSKDFDKALKELGDVDEITIRINSPGGAVNEAIAMRTALMKHKAQKVVDIEGSCCSAATLIACLPGARVRMAKGSDYMIHRCSWAVRGHAADMLSAYNSMVNTDNDMADIYAERTGKTREECLAMMDRTSWFNVEQAMLEGFVDEQIEAAEGEETIAACAVSEETWKVMRDCYGDVPEYVAVARDGRETQNGGETQGRNGGETQGRNGGDSPLVPDRNCEGRPLVPSGEGRPLVPGVSNEKTAVAAGNSSENTYTQGGTGHMELREATADMIQSENPEAAQAIANAAREEALTAERERIARIRKVSFRGAKYDAMRDKAIEDGTSVEDYIAALVAERDKEGAAYIEQRVQETAAANAIGAGDSGDNDGKNAKETEDKLAKEIAELANGMTVNVFDMA